jgi:hypothetical protein
MDMVISPSEKRAAYLRVIADLAAQFGLSEDVVKAKFVIQEKRVIISQTLSTSSNTVDFDPWKSPAGVNNPDEVKLDKNSWLYNTAIGLWVSQYNPTTGDYNYPVFSYVDTNAFAKAGEALALTKVYRGVLSYNAGSANRLQDISTSKFLYAPETQVFVPTAGAAFSPMFNNKNSVSEIQPYQVIDGSGDNTFTLKLGQGVSTNIDGSSTGALRNRVLLVLDGFEVKNAPATAEQCLRGF